MYNIGVPQHSQLWLLEAGLWFLGGWKLYLICIVLQYTCTKTHFLHTHVEALVLSQLEEEEYQENMLSDDAGCSLLAKNMCIDCLH